MELKSVWLKKIQLFKLHIFLEGHKILQTLPLTFDYSIHTVKSKGKTSQNFVAFSEYMNFIGRLGKSDTGHFLHTNCIYGT